MPADPSRTEERDLVDRCVAGQAQAWEAFVRRYRPLMSGAVRQTLRRFRASEDPDLVRDILQDVFLSLVRNDAFLLRGFNWRCPLAYRLIALSASRTIDALRRQRPAVPLDTAQHEELLWNDLRLADPALSAPNAPDRTGRIEEVLGKLSVQEQVALRLHYWEDLTAEQVGRVLGLQAGSVRSLLTRARDKLKVFLGGLAVL